MDIAEVMALFDFAIEKEKESIRFYHKIMQQANSFALMEAIRKIELYERSHVEKLEELKGLLDKQIIDFSGINVMELIITKFGDELPDSNFTYLLKLALKREEYSYQLYQKLSESCNNTIAKQIFQQLAQEELKHKNFFAELISRSENKK